MFPNRLALSALTIATVLAVACSATTDEGLGAAEAGEDVDAQASETTEVTDELTDAASAVFDEDADLLTLQFSHIEPGSYLVETIGTSFTFTAREELFIAPNSYGQFVVADRTSRGPTDRDVVIMRLSHLTDPSDPASPLEQPGPAWPATDLAGWVDTLDPGFVLSPLETTQVGGLDAVRVDVEFGSLECPVDVECFIGRNHFMNGQDLVGDVRYRIWMLDGESEAPIFILAAAAGDKDAAWFDSAEDLLSTLAFGDVGPNVVTLAPAGRATAPFLGGIAVELPGELFIVDDLFGRIGHLTEAGVEAEFITNPRTMDSDLLGTTDELVAHLEANGVVVDELEPTTIGGLDARVFDVGANGTGPIIRPREEAGAWAAPPRARLWAVEHPERGLLMITAEAFWDPDTNFPIVLEQTQPIVDSLEFIELG